MVSQWRTLINNYNQEKGGDTRVLFTEAYASIENTIRYYTDEQGNPRAHFPFNFILIERLNEDSDALAFKTEIDSWMSQVPAGSTSNWVVSEPYRSCSACISILFTNSSAITTNQDLALVMEPKESTAC